MERGARETREGWGLGVQRGAMLGGGGLPEGARPAAIRGGQDRTPLGEGDPPQGVDIEVDHSPRCGSPTPYLGAGACVGRWTLRMWWMQPVGGPWEAGRKVVGRYSQGATTLVSVSRCRIIPSENSGA